MHSHLPILQSKLTLPQVPHTLERKRLIDPLRAISHKKLALVIAGAGYGKTTLVAQTVTQLQPSTNVIWYSLDHLDKDAAIFLGHLLAGLQAHHPDLGRDLSAMLAAPIATRESREKLLLALLVELEKRISAPLVIVLEDYHQVRDNREIAEILEFLFPRMQAMIHFIIISRTAPDLKISRYRAMLEVVEVTEDNLAFRVEEVESLYQHLLQVDLDPSQIQTLYLKTGGWAAALLLFFNAIKAKPTGAANEDLLDIGKSEKLIFKYLEENIFDVQPAEIQFFLMRSALLGQLDPDFCNDLFGMQNAHIILNDLARNHLLTFPCDDAGECYQYHQLLRAFLRNRLAKQYGRKSVRALHSDIAHAMEQKGDLRGALHHFTSGEHFEDVIRLLSGLALLDFRDIPISFLKETLDRIPPSYFHQNARLLYIRAKVMSISGHIRQAIGEFKAALERFKADGDKVGAAACLKDLGFHHYLTGDLENAIREMKALWALPHDDPFFPVEVAGYLILFSAIMGDTNTADGYYHEAVDKFAALENVDSAFILAWFGLCRGYRFHVAGNFHKADTLNTKALELFSSMQFEIFLPITYFQSALTAYYLADPSRGYEYTQKGLAIARKLGIFDNQYAWLLYSLALNEFGRDRAEQALAQVQEALDLFQVYDNAWGQALAHECRGMILGGQRRWDEALDAFNAAMAVLGRLDQRRTPGQGALALGMAEALMEKGLLSQAANILEAHETDIRISHFHLFRCHQLQACIEAANHHMDGAVAHLDTALGIAKTNGYHDWVPIQHPSILPLLVECHHLQKHRDYVEQLFMDADRSARAALNLVKNKKKSSHLRRTIEHLLGIMPHKVPAPLNIRCLGNFSVSIGDRAIPSKQWRSAKATLLFKYMVVKHEQGMIPQEALLEVAWPDEDAAVTRPRLHVALNTLRRLLEPDLVRGVPSAYIIRHNNGYRLEIGRNGRIDILDFIHTANAAAAVYDTDPDLALDRFVNAASIYRGMLLKEDPYEEWMMHHRESLEQRFLKVLSNIIRLYEKQGAWHQCIAYADTYLLHDKYAEPVYRDLMRFHANAGNPSGAVETFHKCQKRIGAEMDCPLSQHTVNLYKKLTQT